MVLYTSCLTCLCLNMRNFIEKKVVFKFERKRSREINGR